MSKELQEATKGSYFNAKNVGIGAGLVLTAKGVQDMWNSETMVGKAAGLGEAVLGGGSALMLYRHGGHSK